MEDSRAGLDSHVANERDALAELIHSAGRRPPPPAADYAVVRAAAHAAWRSKVRARRSRRVWLAAAASIAVVVAAAALVRVSVPPAAGPLARLARVEGSVQVAGVSGSGAPIGMEIRPGDAIRTGADAGAALAFVDGTTLRLASETAIELTSASAFSLERGTVYVDSDDSPTGSTLAIATPFGIVTDVGTRFEVRSDAAALRVRVRSGLVRLSESTVVADLDGGAGDEFEVAADGSVGLRRIAPDDPVWRWIEALAVAPASGFDSIRDCFEWIARETGREIRFDSPSTEIQAELRDMSGSPDGLLPMELLDFIQRISDFDYAIQPDNSILISRK